MCGQCAVCCVGRLTFGASGGVCVRASSNGCAGVQVVVPSGGCVWLCRMRLIPDWIVSGCSVVRVWCELAFGESSRVVLVVARNDKCG